MKRWRVPLVEKVLILYVGPGEWQRYVRETQKAGCGPPRYHDGEPPEGSGMQCGSYVFVYGLDHPDVLLHELSHFVDNLMEDINTSDTEFRAYISQWIYTTVLNWAGMLNATHE